MYTYISIWPPVPCLYVTGKQCTCPPMCMPECTPVCLPTCEPSHLSVCVPAYTLHFPSCPYVHPSICLLAQLLTCTRLRTCLPTPAQISACLPACLHTHLHICMPTHSCLLTFTHAHLPTSTPSLILILFGILLLGSGLMIYVFHACRVLHCGPSSVTVLLLQCTGPICVCLPKADLSPGLLFT